jgi:hypothetical protein
MRWERRGHRHLLVVVHDLDVVGVAGLPAEADAPLVVDADRVLTLPVALEPFESVAGGDPQVGGFLRGIEHAQLAQGSLARLRGPLLAPLPGSEAFGVTVTEAVDTPVRQRSARRLAQPLAAIAAARRAYVCSNHGVDGRPIGPKRTRLPPAAGSCPRSRGMPHGSVGSRVDAEVGS